MRKSFSCNVFYIVFFVSPLVSTVNSTSDFGLCTALISKTLVLILNGKFIALRAVDRTVKVIVKYAQSNLYFMAK
jgi:hypothetical protein